MAAAAAAAHVYPSGLGCKTVCYQRQAIVRYFPTGRRWWNFRGDANEKFRDT